MVFGDGAFGRSFGLDEGMRVGPTWLNWRSYKGDTRSLALRLRGYSEMATCKPGGVRPRNLTVLAR